MPEVIDCGWMTTYNNNNRSQYKRIYSNLLRKNVIFQPLLLCRKMNGNQFKENSIESLYHWRKKKQLFDRDQTPDFQSYSNLEKKFAFIFENG